MSTTRRWPFGVQGTSTAVVALAALGTGYYGFTGYLPHSTDYARASVVDRIFYTLQLFVLGPSPFGGPPYGWWLSVASFLAPLSTVMALLLAVSAAFRASREAWTVSRARGHDVVVGASPEAFALAQQLAARNKARAKAAGGRTAKVVLLGSTIGADVARRHDVHVVEGQPVDEAALRAAGVPGAARVFALDTSGAANAAVALHVRSLHEEPGPRSSRRPASDPPAVAVHARVDNPELGAAMRARRLGAAGERGFRVDFFSLEAIAAVALLDEHPPGPAPLVVGSDRFALAVRDELERRRRRAGVDDRVVVVPSAKAEAEAESLAPPPGSTTYVCAADADTVLRAGLHLMLSDHPRVVLCLGRKAALAGALEQRLFDRVNQLSVFGVLDAACDPDRLTGNALIEQLARALHAYYLREYGGSGQASHVPWDELSDRLKDDNREQAGDIGAKLASIQAVIVPAAPKLPEFFLTDDEVELLAEREHARWMANKRRNGVVHGPQRTATTHPDMLPWQELDEDVKEKDRMFVRGLPKLLAAEDLAIVRRATVDG